ncbi:hypothetical protein PCAR4_90067 [Paraburkholderia caribensis]|nr:hypothetical protein PCAR4_90067 [Paraburkholderia caribensis]
MPSHEARRPSDLQADGLKALARRGATQRELAGPRVCRFCGCMSTHARWVALRRIKDLTHASVRLKLRASALPG